MSKNIKGLICALIAGMMVTTSCGLTSLAAEESAADNATETTETTATDTTDVSEDEKDAEEATEAPEATEEAAEPSEEATEATSTSAYEDDDYYNNALQLCSALGIIEGYEDGSVQPDSTVTRAEMATIILRMLNTAAASTYSNVFIDVTSEHWAANNIQTAVEQGIVDGMGDGTFVPDGPVTYEQVIKMIVCALNYGTDADRQGGYPNGYISVGGSTLSLLDGVKGQMGVAMPRGEVIKAVYNALNAPYRTLDRFENGNPVYTAVDTLGIAKFDMYEDEGILTATPNMTISAGTVTKDDRVVIDGVQYLCHLTGLDDYLGSKVEFFYIDSKDDDPEIISINTSGQTTQYTFNADDISEMDYQAGNLRVYTSATSSSTKKYDIGSATVIYNGTVLTSADFAASEYAEDTTYNDFIVPKVGTVKIIDYDKDNVYDVLMVDSYETMLVTSATSEKVSGKINNANATIDVSNDANDKTITVTKAGAEATAKNLRKNDVASIKRNIDNTMIDITVTGETVTGDITSVGEDDGDTTIMVNGQEYKVDPNAVDNARVGTSVILYLDIFDRVGYIESATGSMLGKSDKYAIVANAYVEDNGEVAIKLFNQDGESLTLKPAGSVKYWGPNDTSARTIDGTELVDLVSADSSFIKCDGMPVKLCKYRLNSSGDISQLYFATPATDSNASTDALRMYVDGTGDASLQGVASVGGAVSGYYIQDGITQFTIPKDASDRRDPSNYSVGTATGSNYTVYDGGANISYAIGDFVNNRYPTVLVRFEAGANQVSPLTDIVTSANNPTFMLSKIIEAVDSEGETVFELTGYTGGSEVTYMTTSNTGIYDIADLGVKEYTGDTLFDATKDDPEKLMSAIQPGDIFVVNSSGSEAKTLGRLVDVNDLAKSAVTGSSGVTMAPTGVSYNQGSRDTYFAGFVSQVDISDSAFISLTNYERSASGSVAYDPSAVFSYATIQVDTEGNLLNVSVDKSGGMEAGEIMCYGDDPTEFDYGLYKLFKGGMQNGYVIRIQIQED